MKKIAVITCYKQPDYIRAVTLRRAIKSIPGVECFFVKNRTHGFMRYAEVVAKLVKLRISKNPDIYLVTFRGYEILPWVTILGFNKRIIFDEFINPIEWLIYEHSKFKRGGLLEKSIKFLYLALLKRVDLVLTDTKAHARYSANLLGLPLSKYKEIPVGTDERLFISTQKHKASNEFIVFYYGSMLPLHGLEYVCKAAVYVAGQNPDIVFSLIGGEDEARKIIQESIEQGANIKYRKWVDFSELPKYVANSSLCLGGPFGNTVQSNMVITGKTFQFLASKKPVVVGRVTDNNTFKNKHNSLIVKQGSAAAIADMVIWASENEKELKNIAEEGFRLFKQHYSTREITKKLEKAIF